MSKLKELIIELEEEGAVAWSEEHHFYYAVDGDHDKPLTFDDIVRHYGKVQEAERQKTNDR